MPKAGWAESWLRSQFKDAGKRRSRCPSWWKRAKAAADRAKQIPVEPAHHCSSYVVGLMLLLCSPHLRLGNEIPDDMLFWSVRRIYRGGSRPAEVVTIDNQDGPARAVNSGYGDRHF